ncbi:MAG: SDR family NAD(P)-dependent oxidoreductase [Pseudobdellovibrio sp.]
MYRFIYFFKFRSPPRDYKPVILVTGCSSGIGLALASLLYNRTEYRVLVTARIKSLGVLKQKFAETDRFKIMPMDVGILWGGIDIIVNNAGICYRSVLEEMSYGDELTQLETNYHGPISLIKHNLPYMRKVGRGKIINISSVSGLLAMPTMASYSASKFALEGASEALWYEMKPFGINVSVIQPGFVRSNSFERTKFSVRSEISTQFDKPYTDLYKNMIPFVARAMSWGIATPESIARLVLDVIRTQDPPLWIATAVDSEFFYYLKRFMPRRLLQPFLYSLLPNAATWSARHSKKRTLTFWKKIKAYITRRYYD